MKNVLIIGAAIIFLALAGLVFAFADNPNHTTPPPVTQDQLGGTSPTPPVTEPDIKTFEVSGIPFSFTPATIRVNQGDTVRIIFTSEEGTHDWVIDEFNARTNILSAGQAETISFVADQAGTFEYYCSVNNHREMGMVGQLIVE